MYSDTTLVHPLASTGATPVPIVPTVTTPVTKGTCISHFNLIIILEIDVKKLKQIIDRLVVSFHADLTDLPKSSLPSLANQLYTSGLISNDVKDKPSIDEFISEFKAGFRLLRKVSQVKDHCKKFLKAFMAVGGSYAIAANVLHEDWIETINNELDDSFNFNLD